MKWKEENEKKKEQVVQKEEDKERKPRRGREMGKLERKKNTEKKRIGRKNKGKKKREKESCCETERQKKTFSFFPNHTLFTPLYAEEGSSRFEGKKRSIKHLSFWFFVRFPFYNYHQLLFFSFFRGVFAGWLGSTKSFFFLPLFQKKNIKKKQKKQIDFSEEKGIRLMLKFVPGDLALNVDWLFVWRCCGERI